MLLNLWWCWESPVTDSNSVHSSVPSFKFLLHLLPEIYDIQILPFVRWHSDGILPVCCPCLLNLESHTIFLNVNTASLKTYPVALWSNVWFVSHALLVSYEDAHGRTRAHTWCNIYCCQCFHTIPPIVGDNAPKKQRNRTTCQCEAGKKKSGSLQTVAVGFKTLKMLLWKFCKITEL